MLLTVARLCLLPTIISGSASSAKVQLPLQYKREPIIFDNWDDSESFNESANRLLTACEINTLEIQNDTACQHSGEPDTNVKDKLRGVMEYYNSDRAMKLISEAGALPANSFHSPFSIHLKQPKMKLDESEYMVLLTKLNISEHYTVLDYGCGLGRFARRIAEETVWEVHCVNIAEKQVEAARQLTPDGTVTYAAYGGHRLPYEAGFFDAIFFQESFSFHTPNQCEIAAEFARTLRPNGWLVGLDFMTAVGLTTEEYAYWIAPINLAWEATTGSPEGLARCFRKAGLHSVELIDTLYMDSIPLSQRPAKQFLHGNDKQRLFAKYGTLQAQLSLASFSEPDRHMYAVEAMSFAIENRMYWEGFIVARK